jgi:hypothetical protein
VHCGKHCGRRRCTAQLQKIAPFQRRFVTLLLVAHARPPLMDLKQKKLPPKPLFCDVPEGSFANV